jgi:formylglycine-generating enzyme required for sulfatase activity
MAVIGPGRHREAVPTVRMDVHEVTNRQYRLCVRAGRCLPPAEPYALASYDAGKWDLPVVFVTARQAANYCAWTHRRLPTATEWERAARGLNGSPYPWGSAPPDRTRVNADVGGHVPTGLVPAEGAEYGAGTSRDGIVHLAGNAQEWTSTRAREDLESGRVERLGTWNGRDRVDVLLLKGGGWMLPAQLAQVSDPAAATHLGQQTGFRCAAAAD